MKYKTSGFRIIFIKIRISKKQCLDKHKQIAFKELQLFLEFTRKQCSDIGNNFNEIKKIKSRKTVEDLVEMKEFINGIPTQLINYNQIDLTLKYFDLLESFNYKLDSTDFRVKWQTFGWAKCINDQIQQVNLTMTEDKQKYYNELKEQQSQFSVDFDDVKREIAEFDQLFDIKQTNKIAIKAKNLENIK